MNTATKGACCDDGRRLRGNSALVSQNVSAALRHVPSTVNPKRERSPVPRTLNPEP
jgi:hypothetical protein